MAKRVDELHIVEGGALFLGKRRLAFAGIDGDKVKAVIGTGVIKIYPATAKVCQACGELIALQPKPNDPDFCDNCIQRIGGQAASVTVHRSS